MKDAILQHFAGNWLPFFQEYLGDLKPAGKQYRALCPFHDDHHPSLDIEPAQGLWHCKVCDSGGDSFELVKKKAGLDFPGVLKDIGLRFGISCDSSRSGHIGKGSAQKSKGSRKLVKRYIYQDANGNDLFYKNRFEPKGFSICRPNGNGDILNGMGGVAPVLYRLPEVMGASEVWVVEGEKDADALAELGIVATTNFDGAGKWSESYTEMLRGKHIILVPDDDKPGRDHMQNVAKALYGASVSLKILELPNTTSKKGYDISDFLAGQTDGPTAVDKLVSLLEATPLYQPAGPEAGKLHFEFVHNADILKNLRPTEWRIEGVLTDYALYYNFGDPGSFKTFVELDRLLHIASGLDYHGHKVKQGVVFYICGEGFQGIGRRIAAWHKWHNTRADDVPFFISRMPTQLMDMNHLKEVRQQVDLMASQYGQPAVVQLDTLARNFGDGDENSSGDMSTAISNLDQAFGTDYCRGLTHHTGHGNKDRARGSMALHGAADAAYKVSVTEGGLVLVECKKMKDAPTPPPMLFKRQEVQLTICGVDNRSFVLELEAEGEDAQVTNSKPIGSAKMAQALDVLRRMSVFCHSKGTTIPMVSYTQWRAACIKEGIYARTDLFDRAAERLFDRDYACRDDAGNVYLPEFARNTDE